MMNEQDYNKVFAKRLRCYLDKFEMTQVELSKRLGVGTTSVYNWLNAIKTPRMDKVDAMCKIFGCKRSDLMEETSQPTRAAVINVLIDCQELIEIYTQLDAADKDKVLAFAKGVYAGGGYKKGESSAERKIS